MDIEDAVERHDIGWMNRFSKLEEVAVLVGDPAGEAPTVAFLPPFGYKRRKRRCSSLGGAGGQQLVLDRADPSADVNHCRAFDALCLECIDQHPRRRNRPLAR